MRIADMTGAERLASQGDGQCAIDAATTCDNSIRETRLPSVITKTHDNELTGRGADCHASRRHINERGGRCASVDWAITAFNLA